jgi:hypothetical protein
MVTSEIVEQRRLEVRQSGDLRALLGHLADRAAPVLARLPEIPEHKALLSQDGGVCPTDGVPLTFDPWSSTEHRCPRCGQMFRGERHDRHWARFQHLWLSERAAHLAALAALDGQAAAAARAREILVAYAARYMQYPNRDNVLGPSRLFFSTYLESIWILNYLGAAVLLRESEQLDDATARSVAQVADEAANLIGDFDERFSNRQTWNDAALAAIAVWFEDEDLARTAVEGATGLMAHLRGYGDDGLWYEGENYHLFALRGLLTGAAWARLAGVDFFAEPKLRARVVAALRAPALTALPDFTFPARKDSRFGVSLAQPMFLDTWEVGYGMLGRREAGGEMRELLGWLNALYRVPAPRPELFESYLHDAGALTHDASRLPPPASRASLSWWALLLMPPELPGDSEPWVPPSVLLRGQGLGVLRTGARYVSLESGPLGGGHGHPDRLHLTLHAGGVHWLRDFGTGSYVSRDLFWYRSSLAHNVPIVDGGVGAWNDAECECFDVRGAWSWARGRVGNVTRTVVSGPDYVVDVVELYGEDERALDLPWHLTGGGDVGMRGEWRSAALENDYVTAVERFVPADPDAPLVLRCAVDGARLTVHFVTKAELWRALGLGPGGGGNGREPFFLLRARGRNLRLVTVIEPHVPGAEVRGVRVSGDVLEVDTATGVDRHALEFNRWTVKSGGKDIELGGAVARVMPFRPLLDLEPSSPSTGIAFRVANPPALDGTLGGFDAGEPLRLELEDQYRRSEEPYPGPAELSATACAGWDDEALYLAVQVTKPALLLRPAEAPPLRLDNEPDDIHSDGLQIYIAGDGDGGKGEGYIGYLVVPEEGGGLRVRPTSGTQGAPAAVRGAWRRTDGGYCVTLGVAWTAGWQVIFGARLGFDLIINEMLPGRVRRAGQLVWSGGNGWVWLRGDRQDPERFGVLELVG